MSASHKKQLRREENRAAMTERQEKEMKEAKKLRLYTIIFAVAIVAMVAVVIVTSVTGSGIIERNTTAVTVNDTEISAVELNYYYMDSINNFMNSYGSYATMMGLDTTLSLNDQYFDEENGQTWADYMLEMATENIKTTYGLYLDAVANGYTLSEEAQQEIDTTLSNIDTYALLYGYSDADSYLRGMYGPGSNEDTYRQYMTVQYIASNYYNDTLDTMEYTDEELRAAEADNYDLYSSYSYNYYYLTARDFYEGGTTDEEGVTTYSDEEKAAGVEKCKAAADVLAEATTLAELETAIDALDADADTTAVVDRLYTSVDAQMSDWITSSSRKEGDMTCIENATTSTADDGTETTTVNGYYLVYFVGKNENTFPLANVRHILLSHEGGTTDENGTTTYSDEEKAATLAKAEELLASFTSGEATEDAFAALANENSTDTGSNTNGGLYENVYPGEMVTNFNDWCFDESRKAGDTGIVESDYGYHIMYFAGQSDMTYRDYMISNDLMETDINEWQTSLAEAVEVTIVDSSNVNKDIHLNTGA